MGFLGATRIFKGLENVAVAETSLSYINGEEGKLIYRGIPVEVLAEKASFEEVAFLLWFGHLPKKEELDGLVRYMSANRNIHPEIENYIARLPNRAHPMDILRSCVSLFSIFEDPQDSYDELQRAARITGKLPTIVSYHYRQSRGMEPVLPDKSLDHASNFYYMITGKKPDEEISKLMNSILILHAEQGLNASTFTAMVIASTLSDMYSSVTGAIGALKGSLHGGANEKVIDMIEEIGIPENVEDYVEKALKEKRKIPGFGHRVYKTYDPRSKVLREYARKLSLKMNDTKYFPVAEQLEKIVVEKLAHKKIFPNVDLYSGIVYKLLGFPKEIYTAIFAIARVVGWTAHVIEYTKSNKIIRPCGVYVGPMNAEYIPLEARE